MVTVFRQQYLFVYRERFLKWTTFLAMVLAILAMTVVVLVAPRSERIPLQYDPLFGIGRIGPWYQLLWYPCASMVLSFTNALFAVWVYPRDKYLAYYVTSMSVLVAFVIVVYVVDLWIAYL